MGSIRRPPRKDQKQEDLPKNNIQATSKAEMKFTQVELCPEKIPKGLQVRDRWMLWEPDARYQPKAPRTIIKQEVKIASSLEQQNWLDFSTAIAWTKEGYGLGFVLSKDNQEKQLLCLDIDGKLEDHQLELPESEQRAIIDQHVALQERMIVRTGGYAERSPSGRGIHIWFYGNIDFEGRKKGNMELYAGKRFMSVTGAHIKGSPEQIPTIPEKVLQELIEEHFPKAEWSNINQRPKIGKSKAFDYEELKKLPSGKTMYLIATKPGSWEEIYRTGDDGKPLKDHRGAAMRRYPSQSEADFALMNALAKITENNPSLMDRAFRDSALMRKKYEEWRGDMSNGEKMIAKAIAANPKKQKRVPLKKANKEHPQQTSQAKGTQSEG